MPVIFVKGNGPQSWRIAQGIAGEVVELTCPNGHIGDLDHEINDDGDVHPSVDCPRIACDFHDYIKLESWGA